MPTIYIPHVLPDGSGARSVMVIDGVTVTPINNGSHLVIPTGPQGPAGPAGPTGATGAASAWILTGLTTSAMTGGAGTLGYLSAASTLSPADASTPAKQPVAVFTGTSGQAQTHGNVSLQFTAFGGAPAINAPVYAAAASDEAGAIGKASAVPTPVAPGNNGAISKAFLEPIGWCKANAGFPLCEVLLSLNAKTVQSSATDIYIDPSNVGGLASDGNSGAIGAPLKTWRAAKMRLGWTPSNPLIAIWGVNIHWLSDQPDQSDPVDCPTLIYGQLQHLGAGGQTVLHTDTIDVLTTRVRTPIASMTSWKIKSNGLAGNGFTAYVDRLLIDTSQTPNLVSFVDYDLSVDVALPQTQTARVQEWMQAASLPITNLVYNHGTPVQGDTYQVVQLPKIYLADTDAKLGYTSASNQTANSLVFNRLELAGQHNIEASFYTRELLVQVIECLVSADVSIGDALGVQWYECRFLRNVTVHAQCHAAYFFGCTLNLLGTGLVDEPWQFRIAGYATLYDDCAITHRVGGYDGSLRIAKGGKATIATGMGFWCKGSAIQIDNCASLTLISGATIYGGEGDMTPAVGVQFGANAALTYAASATGAHTFCIKTTSQAWSFGGEANFSGFFVPWYPTGVGQFHALALQSAWTMFDNEASAGAQGSIMSIETGSRFAHMNQLGGT